MSLALDVLLGSGTYLVAYWLRFHDGRLPQFLPGALTTLPAVVAGQVAGLALLRAYGRHARVDWLIRVVSGVVLGTGAAGGLLNWSIGFEGASRGAVAADAVLFSIVAVGWRCLWVLNARTRSTVREPGELVDRAAQMTTVRGVLLSLVSYRELLKNLVLKDIKLKYRGSFFGFLWSLANPLLMMIVYTVAFTVILQIRSEGFVFSLMLGLLAWTFFSSSAVMATSALIENAGLLKSVLFPRAILPIATVLFNLSQYLLTAAVFLPALMLWHHVLPSSALAAFPIFLALQVLLTIGIALLLAAGTVFFRDVKHLLEVALAVLFWTTPIVYELAQVPERLRLAILLSPISSFVVAYQQIFYYRTWPEATVWIVASMYAVGAFAVGALLFVALEDRFTEQM